MLFHDYSDRLIVSDYGYLLSWFIKDRAVRYLYRNSLMLFVFFDIICTEIAEIAKNEILRISSHEADSVTQSGTRFVTCFVNDSVSYRLYLKNNCK